MEQEKKNFRDFVESEYWKRMDKNSNYSLRAYARDLDVDPSLLSKLLRGKRSFTENMIHHIGQKMELNEVELFPYKKSLLDDPKWVRLDESEEDVLSHWSCFAIAELMKIKEFQSNSKWIAKRLNISTEQAEKSLESLKACGIVGVDQRGKLNLREENTISSNLSKSSSLRRRLQEQYLDLAKKSILKDSYSSRHHSGLTVCIDKKMIPHIKTKTKVFFMEINKLAESSKSPEEVYQMSLSLFPLSGDSE